MNLVDKSDVYAVRAVFIILLGGVTAAFRPFSLPLLPAAGAGAAFGLLVVGLEMRLRRVSLRPLIAGVLGMLVGSVLGILLVALFALSSLRGDVNGPLLEIAVPLSQLRWAGCRAFQLRVAEFERHWAIQRRRRGQAIGEAARYQRADRRPDCGYRESGFLDGSLVVPQFVLHEFRWLPIHPIR